jgi:hypothetical protein
MKLILSLILALVFLTAPALGSLTGPVPLSKLVSGDVTIDVYYPKSAGDSTSIIIQQGSEETNIEIYQTSEPGNYEADVTVNSNHGDPNSNEAEARFIGAQDSTSTSATDSYSYTTETFVGAGYGTSTGQASAVSWDHVESSSYNYTEGTSEVYTYDYAVAYEQDGQGNNETSYMEHAKDAYYDGENVYYETVTVGENDQGGFYSHEIGQGTEDANGNGSGASYSETTWWVNSQAVEGSTGMSWFSTLLVACVLAAVGVLAYRKYTAVKAKKYSLTDRETDSQLSYIRI